MPKLFYCKVSNTPVIKIMSLDKIIRKKHKGIVVTIIGVYRHADS